LANDKLDLLMGHSLFRGVDPALIEHITELGVKRKLAADQSLFVKGDEGDALYGVLSGSIRISSNAPTGKELIFNILYPGDLFGEIALLDGKKRTADATAMVPTELLCIYRREFLTLLKDEPDLAIHFLHMVCDRLRKTSEMVEDSVFLSLGPRLAKRLLNLSRFAHQSNSSVGPGVINISQFELGQSMGVSRESINKHLAAWRNHGWIALERNKISVFQEAALQQLIKDEEGG